MAVQAQFPWNAFGVPNPNGVYDDLQQMQHGKNQSVNPLPMAGYINYSQQLINGTVVSDPVSDLTCNVSATGKRNRTEEVPLMQEQQLRFADFMKNTAKAGIPTEPSCKESAEPSTSGRCAAAVSLSSSPQDLISFYHHQNREIDALITHQGLKLKMELEELQKRQNTCLLSIVQQKAVRKLKEKEVELKNANRRNAELEEKLRQLIAQNQMWFVQAKNNEAIISNLRTSLNQMHSAGTAKEGYGDSGDAQSCCYQQEPQSYPRRKWTCKVCGEKDVSVLLLPCRHLCLCNDCEPKLHSCPICNCAKSATLQILMP